MAGPRRRIDLVVFPVLVLTRTTRDWVLQATQAVLLAPWNASVIVGQNGPAAAHVLTEREPGRPPLLAEAHEAASARTATIAAGRLRPAAPGRTACTAAHPSRARASPGARPGAAPCRFRRRHRRR